jgi:hypothetical protein
VICTFPTRQFYTETLQRLPTHLVIGRSYVIKSQPSELISLGDGSFFIPIPRSVVTATRRDISQTSDDEIAFVVLEYRDIHA